MQLETIPKEKELIILDLNGTIAYRHIESHSRDLGHFEEIHDAYRFVQKIKDQERKVAISTDTEDFIIENEFLRFEPKKYTALFDGIYGQSHLKYIKENEVFRPIKNLEKICNDLQTDIKNAIFIGDNFEYSDFYTGKYVLDSFSAEHFDMDYIIIPKKKDYSLLKLL